MRVQLVCQNDKVIFQEALNKELDSIEAMGFEIIDIKFIGFQDKDEDCFYYRGLIIYKMKKDTK